MDLIEKLFAGIQSVLPQKLLSRLVHGFMHTRFRLLKNAT